MAPANKNSTQCFEGCHLKIDTIKLLSIMEASILLDILCIQTDNHIIRDGTVLDYYLYNSIPTPPASMADCFWTRLNTDIKLSAQVWTRLKRAWRLQVGSGMFLQLFQLPQSWNDFPVNIAKNGLARPGSCHQQFIARTASLAGCLWLTCPAFFRDIRLIHIKMKKVALQFR